MPPLKCLSLKAQDISIKVPKTNEVIKTKTSDYFEHYRQFLKHNEKLLSKCPLDIVKKTDG